MKINICIVDDHPIVISGLENMLKDNPLIHIMTSTTNSATLLKILEKSQPDVILLDIQMPNIQGDELTKILVDKYPHIGVLILTNMDHTFHIRNLFHCGAKGYLLKSAPQSQLIDAITTVQRGNTYLDPSLQAKMAFEGINRATNKTLNILTKREQRILELIAEQKTATEICNELYLSKSTVENHRTNLFFKLEVKNAAGLVRKAIQLGLLKP